MRDEDDFKDDFRLRICTLKEGRSYTFCCVALFLCLLPNVFSLRSNVYSLTSNVYSLMSNAYFPVEIC